MTLWRYRRAMAGLDAKGAKLQPVMRKMIKQLDREFAERDEREAEERMARGE
jgi:type II secretory pathway component PulF